MPAFEFFNIGYCYKLGEDCLISTGLYKGGISFLLMVALAYQELDISGIRIQGCANVIVKLCLPNIVSVPTWFNSFRRTFYRVLYIVANFYFFFQLLSMHIKWLTLLRNVSFWWNCILLSSSCSRIWQIWKKASEFLSYVVMWHSLLPKSPNFCSTNILLVYEIFGYCTSKSWSKTIFLSGYVLWTWWACWK